MRHRPKFKIKLTDSLYLEMSGGGWAQQEEPALFAKMVAQEHLTYDEVKEAREGIDTTIIAIEAVQGGGSPSFEEGRALSAAKRSAESLLRKIDSYLKSNA